MRRVNKALIILIILGISAIGCKNNKKSGKDDQLGALTNLMILMSLSNAATCVNTGTNHYFGTARDNSQNILYLQSADGSCWEKYSGTGPEIKYGATGTGISVTSDGTKSEIYYTTDGQNYTKAVTPVFAGNVTDIKFFNGAFYAAVSDSTVKILTSTDGKTWTKPANTGLTLTSVNAVTGYANGGTNYLMATANSSTCPVFNRSTDGGANWTAPGVCVWAGFNIINSLMSGNSTVVGFDSSGQMLKSTDHGASFTQSYPLSGRISTSNPDVKGLGFFAGKYFVQAYKNSTAGYPVFTSPDGINWTESGATTFGGTSTSVSLLSNVVQGASNRLVSPYYYSEDGGNNWKKSTGYKLEATGGSFYIMMPSYVLYVP